jgi:hypothetical protein
MIAAVASRGELWRRALLQGSVWKRALKLGLTAGLIQATINQGDAWARGAVSSTVVVKSIVSPLVGFLLVLVASAATCVDNFRKGSGHGD